MLSKKLNEKDDLELISQTAHTAINLRKYLNALVFIINQLNGEIEKPIRRDNPALHYPTKGDIHCGNQIFWACDDVLIFNRPEKLDIKIYGQGNAAIYTNKLIHLSWYKSRKGFGGNIWFHENFKEGNIIQKNFEDLPKPIQTFKA